MATQAIDATIFASSHPDIAKRTSISGLLISCVMLLIGILSLGEKVCTPMEPWFVFCQILEAGRLREGEIILQQR